MQNPAQPRGALHMSGLSMAALDRHRRNGYSIESFVVYQRGSPVGIKKKIKKELIDLDDTIEELTGKRCTLFRPPFGEYNNTVIDTVREAGYEVIQWTRDTVDWKKERSAQTILDGVLPKLQSGDIILSHNNGYKIETYLPILIETCQKNGYTFVTVSELLLEGETGIDGNGIQYGK